MFSGRWGIGGLGIWKSRGVCGQRTTGVHQGTENCQHLKDMLACEVSGETRGLGESEGDGGYGDVWEEMKD